MPEKQPQLNLDGRDVDFEPGETVMQVAKRNKGDVPHYCWHPGLSVSGNCRMCMVEIEGWRTPQIACNTAASEGMVVRTSSEVARGAQSDVMELMLINHPLDCPICDQAGECKLQELSFEIGSDRSRFEFPKNHNDKNVRFSDKITFDAERCILCTRCIRFCDEVAGEDELDIVGRGDRNTIAVGRGEELTNPYQLNTVDVCPVGALTSTDFRFKSRVWFLRQTRSVCGSCSRGCNTAVGVRWNKVLRMVPAENPGVNKWWMCDDGRLNFKHVAADDRLGAPMVRKDGVLAEANWKDAITAAAEGLRAAGRGIFAVVSARLTNEELFLATSILRHLGAGTRLYKARGGEQDDILRTGDGNPNAFGARLMGVENTIDEGTAAALAESGAKAAILFGEDVDEHPELLAALAKLDFVLVLGSHESETVDQAASVVLAGVTSFEKEGSFTNVDGHVQRIRPCVKAPGDARPDWKVLGKLREQLSRATPPKTIGTAFKEMAAATPAFAGLTLAGLGQLGKPVAGSDSSDSSVAENAEEAVAADGAVATDDSVAADDRNAGGDE